jgi:hypothetical protein
MDLNGAQRGKAPTWVRNNIVGLVALFVALSGTTYAAQAINDRGGIAAKAAKKKKVKRGPAGPPGPTGPAGPAGSPAANALTLGGLPASSYQQSCSVGAIWGFATIDTTGLVPSPTFTTVPGFNCRGGPVQIRQFGAPGSYAVKFVDNITAFAIGTMANLAFNRHINVSYSGTPGEFNVTIADPMGNGVDNTRFTIVAI